MRRRTFLLAATLPAAATAGCVGAPGADGGDEPEGDADDGPGPEPAGEPNDAPAGADATEDDDPRANGDGAAADGDQDGAGDGDPADEDTEAVPPAHADYDATAVRVVSPTGLEKGRVTAAIADTGELRYRGLSDTDHLPADRGMLFVYGSVGNRTFVMRRMDFGIDIVYADADGTITSIHHAPAPGPDEDGNDQRYPGRGQYVLEVNLHWTTRHGVQPGDVLVFDREG